MKILTLFLFLLPGITICQVLKEDKIDEFTKRKVQRTSWEHLSTTFQFQAHFRFSKYDSSTFFDLRMMQNDIVFSIQEGQEIMFMLSSGEIVRIKNLRFAVTCSGCGSVGFGGSTGQGLQTQYKVNQDQLLLLLNSTIVKVRIYIRSGYVEGSIGKKTRSKIINSLNLLH